MADQLPLDQIQVDQQNLYREESITDLRVATIRRLIPITADGTDDTQSSDPIHRLHANHLSNGTAANLCAHLKPLRSGKQ